MILSHHGVTPDLAEDVFVAPNATIIGDVKIGAGSSVWFQTVIRGDVYPIRIGERVNVQDLTMVHVSGGKHETHIEDEVTIGHGAVVHGCRLQKRCLIGIRAVILDGAIVGEESLIAAGSIVTPGTVIPPRVLAMGAPCKVKRDLTQDEIDDLRDSAQRYALLARTYQEDSENP